MTTPNLIVALLLGIGLFFVVLALARLRRRRMMAATRAAIGGGTCLLLTALAFSLALNLYTYHRLTWEQPVAQLRFEQVGHHRFRVRLDPVTGPARSYVLAGSQWQLQARVLKWVPLATLLGFNARYRLDRLSGRYVHAEAERTAADTVHDLSPARGLALWQAVQYLPDWLNLIDTRYGSGVYLPMTDGARFSVALSQTGGLVARPQNEAAKQAVNQW